MGYPLWVNGEQVNEDNAGNVLNDAGKTVSYDADTNTLTLDGATLAMEVDDPGDGDGVIAANGDLNILLKGDNTITIPSEKVQRDGIYVLSGELTLTGENGAKLTINGGTETSCGIYGRDDDVSLSVENCKLTVDVAGDAIDVYDGVTIENSALDLTTQGMRAIFTAGDVAIVDSSVKAVVEAGQSEAAIVAAAIAIDNSTVLAQSNLIALYAWTSTEPPENVTTLTGVTAQGSREYEGTNPEPYNKETLYKWFHATPTSHQHTPATEWSYNEQKHWRECTAANCPEWARLASRRTASPHRSWRTST